MTPSRRNLHRVLGLAVTLLLGVSVVGLTPPKTARAQTTPTAPTRAGFTWEMAPRFGIDADGDGRIEIENTYEYVTSRRHPCDGPCPAQRFAVTLRATPAAEDHGLNPDLFSYEWRIESASRSGTYFRSGPELRIVLPEGRHSVDVRITVRLLWGSVTLRSRGDIDVQDHLVVALGDSYASGEGSPDVPRVGDGDALWADAADPVVEEAHALAHRSTVGWPAQVAGALEVADRHSSVTFVDLAASSARIGAGVLRPHSYLDLPAQLDEVERIVGNRRIDVLLVQAGGNDIGFSQMIRELVDADPLLDPICYDVMIDNTWLSVADGRWDRDVSLGYDPPFGIACRPTGGVQRSRVGLDGLGAEFDLLAERLDRLDIGRVVAVQYPDPTGSPTTGVRCDEIVGDATPPFGFHEVDEREQAWGIERVLEPLNGVIADAASRHGWEVVTGVAEAFAEGHGYCAPWPDYGYPDEFTSASPLFRDRLDSPSGWYRPPGLHGGPLLLTRDAVSWYRTAPQSAALQGPAPRFLTAGTLHPNELGHAAMARMVLSVLAGD